MNFRDATIDDLPVIVDIYNSTIASRIVTADTEPVAVKDKVDWFGEHTNDKRPLWIVEYEEHQPVGWVSFQDFYGRPAYAATAEISIYLAERIRGKGYGNKILHYAIEKAPSLGIKTLLGFIFAHNIPSIRLFITAGFEEWANLKNIASLDGKEYSLLILGKRIQ